MKTLLQKELRLSIHPTNVIFLSLSLLLIIPNYPYYLTFFYTSLGLFFLCLNGRENHDIAYSLTLPVRKREIVKSRIAFAAIIELAQLLTAIPVAILRQQLDPVGNAVGMDANIAFFGLSLCMMGLFNIVFFAVYYRNPNHIGKAFVLGSTVEFVYIVAAEALAHVAPFFRDRLDTPDPMFLTEKLAVLAFGILLFSALTCLAYRISVRRFVALDL